MIHVTYNSHQAWNSNQPFYEVLKHLLTSSYTSNTKHSIRGFEVLSISQDDMEFFCEDFLDDNTGERKYFFWQVMAQVNLMCQASKQKELEKYGQQVSDITCDSVVTYIKAKPSIKSFLTNALFPGGLIESDPPTYKTFEEWNVNGSFSHVSGHVYTRLRVNNKNPSLAFALSLLQWSTPELEFSLITQKEFIEATQLQEVV